MSPLLISLGAGVLIGLVYALLKVQSPAPPAVALVGLLGMIVGSTLGGQLFHRDAAQMQVPGQTQSVADPRPASHPSIANHAG
ncbi:XapX domain-containing protein [Pantoea tagorei]